MLTTRHPGRAGVQHRQQGGQAAEGGAVPDAGRHRHEGYADQAADHAGQGALHAGHHDQAVRPGEPVAGLEQPVQPGDADVLDPLDPGPCTATVSAASAATGASEVPALITATSPRAVGIGPERHGARHLVDAASGSSALTSADRLGESRVASTARSGGARAACAGSRRPARGSCPRRRRPPGRRCARPGRRRRARSRGRRCARRALVAGRSVTQPKLSGRACGRSLRLVAGVRAELVRRGHALVHQVRDHPLRARA